MTRSMLLWTLVGNLFLFGCTNESTVPPVQTKDAATEVTAGTANHSEQGTAAEAISNPEHERMNQTAPDEFRVLFHTSAGDFVVQVTRDWAPIGADRFYNLVVNNYYDQTRFFRVAPGRGTERFVVQWGIHGDPSVNAVWQNSSAAKIKDDPVIQANTRGRLTFAMSGPNSRTTQLFISYADNSFLDGMGFSVFGEVADKGMKFVEKINGEYAERPDQGRIQSNGNVYLKKSFPNLDYIITTTIMANGNDGVE